MGLWDSFKRKRGNAKNSITTAADLADVLIAFSNESSSGVSVTPDVALQSPTVFACIRVLSESVAMLPLHLFDRTDEDKPVIIKDHAAIKLLTKRPNENQTPFKFRQLMVIDSALQGNFTAFKNKVGGETRELIYIPQPVTIKQASDLTVTYKINGIEGEKTKKDIFHYYGFSTNGYSGVNISKLQRDIIGLSIALDDYGSKFFRNSGRPSGLLSTEAKLQPDQIKKIVESWNEAVGGEKQLSTALLDNGFKWQQITATPNEAQYLDTKKLVRSLLSAIWRVPSHMINDLESATFSNIENLARQFVDYALMPWLIDLEQTYGMQLLTEKEQETMYFKHNVDGLLRGDSKARAAIYASGIQNAYLSPNEVRKKEDIAPYEGGDEFNKQMNMEPMGPSKDEKSENEE